jgi:phosphoribosylanthranilate isomerase
VAAVKFCGLKRSADAAVAVDLGAKYVGVIFAGGPRQVTIDEALDVLAPTRGVARAVGVFGALAPDMIARIVNEASLDVVQLSADPDEATVDAVRRVSGAEIWATVRCGSELPSGAGALFARADAVHLDARIDGLLGGTGRTIPWTELAPAVYAARGARGRLVLSGGLTPANVGQAVAALTPEIVDVSSGVESAPGIKDHERMRAFTHEAR